MRLLVCDYQIEYVYKFDEVLSKKCPQTLPTVQSPRSLFAARDSWAEETIASGEEQVKTAVFAGYWEKNAQE